MDHPHLRRGAEATWEVVLGTLRVRLGGEDLHVGPGDVICTPPGIVRSFMVTGSEPARLVPRRQVPVR